MSRDLWTSLTDAQLLAQCRVDTYRASGPGGQKRNKTSSAVRIRHPPSGLIVIAEESRSQHENRARALRRLRQSLFLKIRDPLVADHLPSDWHERTAALLEDGRLSTRPRDPRFWPAAGLVLDLMQSMQARVSEVARTLGVSTSNLIEFLRAHPKVWEQANILRARFSQKPLKSP